MPEMISLAVPSAAAYPSAIDAYVVQPTGELKGALIVIHEIWGLVPHIKDVAGRYAAEGYLVVAPDILSAVGIEAEVGLELFGIMTDPDENVRVEGQPRIREAFSKHRDPSYAAWAVPALQRVVDYLQAQPGVEGRIGVLGYCFGGTYSYALVAADPRVRAAAPYYGTAPQADDIAKISAPVHAFIGQDDPPVMDALPGVRENMAASGVDFEATVYPESGHAFFNNTGPRYNAVDAADAWRKTLEFLDAHLR
ncbi:MAG: dienelactone hydrolase family protein [Microbacteriaceae bacterium]|nr:dienelactone hydrolase family protein [Microbacteriaceae bacterium]